MRLVLPVLVWALAACAAPPRPAGPSAEATAAAPVQAPRIDFSRIARDVHARTNAERTRRGLSALAWRDDLARLAAVHSADMAARQFFSHDSPDGRDVNARGTALGLTCEIETDRVVYSGFSENLFQTWTYRGWRDVSDGRATTRTYDYRAEADFAPEIVTGWMNSPGHRANLLAPLVRAEGIALAQAPDGKVYATQVFC